MTIRQPKNGKQSGYTLIELLVYVAIVGAVLTAVTAFFGTVVDARVKNQTILEVNDQGTALMDYITQTIHNASSITAPATGIAGPSLTLAVPTSSLSPTVFNLSGTPLGYSSDGGSTDVSDNNFMNATKFVATTTGTISTLYSLVGPTIGASPNNQGQMAIYSGVASPSTLLASSPSTTLIPSSWNAFTIPTVSVTAGQTYWLAYNANGLSSANNDLRFHTGTTNQAMFTGQTFGTWPASWSGTSQNNEFSMYAMIDSSSTPLGYTSDGGTNGIQNSNTINAVKFVATATGTISTIYALTCSTVPASPNNQGQMAIYSGVASPSTLLASSPSTTLIPSSWNAFTIPTVSVTAGQTYWLAYNANGSSLVDDNLRNHTGIANQQMFGSQTFGTWPASFSGTSNNAEFSMYAMISAPAGAAVIPGTIQVKEGSGTPVPLTNGKVQVSNLTFKNLSRASTPGTIQISFFLSRVNPSSKNEYDYQKLFTGTAEVAW